MSRISKLLAAACMASCLGLATPANAEGPKRDRPDLRCKPEKRNCSMDRGRADYRNAPSTETFDDADDIFSDRPDRNCRRDRALCPTPS